MKREVLLNYLNAKGVSLQLPADKKTLCSEVLKLWGLANNTENYTTRYNYNNSQNNVTVTEVSEDTDIVSQGRETDETANVFGTQFCSWFYKRWNELNGFGDYDFWADCNLRIDLCAAGSEVSMNRIEVQQNGSKCFQELQKLSVTYGIKFEPNLDFGERGMKTRLDPHGLAEIMVCGIIIGGAQGGPVGVFEQVFGLIKDQSNSGNYKIKFSILKCHQSVSKDSRSLQQGPTGFHSIES